MNWRNTGNRWRHFRHKDDSLSIPDRKYIKSLLNASMESLPFDLVKHEINGVTVLQKVNQYTGDKRLIDKQIHVKTLRKAGKYKKIEKFDDFA